MSFDLKERKGQLIKLVFGLLIFTSIFLIFSQVGSYSRLSGVLWETSPFYFSLAILFQLVVIFYYSFRWYKICHSLDLELNVIQGLKVHWASLFYGSVTPSRVGELLKIPVFRAVIDDKADKDKIFSSIIIDRFGDLISISIYAVVFSLLLYYILFDPRLWFFFLFGLSIALFDLLFIAIIRGWHLPLLNKIIDSDFVLFKKLDIFRKLSRYGKNLHYRGQVKEAVKITVSMAMFGFLFRTMVNYFLVQATGADLSIFILFLLTPLISSASFLPLSVGNLGTREAFSVLLYIIVGLSPEKALAVTVLNRLLILIVIYAVGGIIAFGTGWKTVRYFDQDEVLP